MSAYDLLLMAGHFAALSCLSIGGALTTAPEMHRYLVDGKGWLSDQQFTDSIALAQAAPGPNTLFVTLIGWQIGGIVGALVATVSMMLPSSLIAFYGYRLKLKHDDSRFVGALRRGLVPIAIGLTAAAGWLIAEKTDTNWRLSLLTIVSMMIVIRYRLNPLWLIALGAGLGALGWV